MNSFKQFVDNACGDQKRFVVSGEYGRLIAGLDGCTHPQTQESTYWVDVHYQGSAGEADHWRRAGFRLSTLCCLCAAICLGETLLSQELIEKINRQVLQPSPVLH